jgi:hypothetical protein
MSESKIKLYKLEGSETQALLDRLVDTAEAIGYTVSRWQTNKRIGVERITYAVHRGERPSQFRMLAEDQILDYAVLHNMEGATRRSEAYKALARLLDAVEKERK